MTKKPDLKIEQQTSRPLKKPNLKYNLNFQPINRFYFKFYKKLKTGRNSARFVFQE